MRFQVPRVGGVLGYDIMGPICRGMYDSSDHMLGVRFHGPFIGWEGRFQVHAFGSGRELPKHIFK